MSANPRTVYAVSPTEDSPNGVSYFTTKAGAMVAAKAIAKTGFASTVTVHAVTKRLRGSALFAALLNQERWADSGGGTVAVFPAKKVTL